MPEQYFTIRWPDATRQTCYSPSTIVRDFFVPLTEYTVAEFVHRSQTALVAASERVRARYGSPCSLALGQLAQIAATAARFAATADPRILFESFEDTP